MNYILSVKLYSTKVSTRTAIELADRANVEAIGEMAIKVASVFDCTVEEWTLHKNDGYANPVLVRWTPSGGLEDPHIHTWGACGFCDTCGADATSCGLEEW